MIDYRHDPATRVAHLTFDRPAEGNTLNMAAAHMLEKHVEQAIEDQARVLLLDASGKLFCGGGDVHAMSTADDPGRYTLDMATVLHRGLLRLAESDMVFLCAVQGAAAGAGFSIVLNADYVVASDRASFVTAYLALGVTPDAGGSYLLPRVVGKTRASELLLGGRKLDAATAHDWGIVNEVTTPESLKARAAELARDLAAAPARAAAVSKRMLADAWLPGYRAHLEREAASIGALIGSPESRERQAAFLNR